jgi:transposase
MGWKFACTKTEERHALVHSSQMTEGEKTQTRKAMLKASAKCRQLHCSITAYKRIHGHFLRLTPYLCLKWSRHKENAALALRRFGCLHKKERTTFEQIPHRFGVMEES